MSNKAEQEERLRTLLADRSLLRQQGLNTYQTRAITDANLETQGRFAALSKPTVVGATPISYPKMPEDNSFARDPLGPEPLIDATDCGPRLGYRIDGHPESLVSLPSNLEMSRSNTSGSDAARCDRVTLSDPDRGSVALSSSTKLRRL